MSDARDRYAKLGRTKKVAECDAWLAERRR
jgi:hypothetical protein